MPTSPFRRREIVFWGEMLVDKVRRAVFCCFRICNLFLFFSMRSKLRRQQIPRLRKTEPPAKPAPSAQDAQPPASNQTPSDKDKAGQSASNQGKAAGTSAGTSNDRLFLALPNFLTLENVGNVPPLTTAQKFKVVARGSFDKIEFPWYGVLSGISQAENSRPGYGQGWEGYAKRYGSAFAESDHRKLRDERDSSVDSASGSEILPIKHWRIRTPSRICGESNLCYTD